MRRKWLVALLVFNGLSAVGGGLALMAQAVRPSIWTAHTAFTSLYFPGVILLAVVGGSALLAALATWRRFVGWQLGVALSGMIMVIWIVGEIVSIRQWHWLQAIYLASGGALLWLVPASATHETAQR